MSARTFVALEIYVKERKAEFLLNNAVDSADYITAREEVRKLGVDPDSILQVRPASVQGLTDIEPR
jgi:hypothetical protein